MTAAMLNRGNANLRPYRGDRLSSSGLARGGVPVGWEVASAPAPEVDVFLVRKLGVPQWRELAMTRWPVGAGSAMNDDVVQHHRPAGACGVDSERQSRRRERRYRRSGCLSSICIGS